MNFSSGLAQTKNDIIFSSIVTLHPPPVSILWTRRHIRVSAPPSFCSFPSLMCNITSSALVHHIVAACHIHCATADDYKARSLLLLQQVFLLSNCFVSPFIPARSIFSPLLFWMLLFCPTFSVLFFFLFALNYSCF